MRQQNLEKYGAYQRALELFDLVVQNMNALSKEPMCWRLVSQQIGCADSITANIEEGYGRVSQAEYKRFLDFARASARETRGRYGRLKHWLSNDLIVHRQKLIDEIIGILKKTISILHASINQNKNRYFGVKEECESDGVWTFDD